MSVFETILIARPAYARGGEPRPRTVAFFRGGDPTQDFGVSGQSRQPMPGSGGTRQSEDVSATLSGSFNCVRELSLQA
jgi:hypothetical protein